MDNRKSRIVAMRRLSDSRVKPILGSEWSAPNGAAMKERDAVIIEFTSGVQLNVMVNDSSGIQIKDDYTDQELDTDQKFYRHFATLTR